MQSSTDREELTEIPKEKVWNAKRIHTVVNNLSALPESPECPRLIELNFQNSPALTSIPPSFFEHMSVLRLLDLSNTNIQCLPESLPKLVALKKLILRHCVLFRELTPLVGKLNNLEELDLHETQIVDLPREIGNLSKLNILRVSFYGYMDCGKTLQRDLLVHQGTIGRLSRLTELSIDVNPDDKRWIPASKIVMEEACCLKKLLIVILYLPNLTLLLKGSIDTISPMYSQLECFRFTVGKHRQRIINRVPKKVEAQFQEWDKCLKFVKGEDVPVGIEGVLSSLTAFYLDRHATATSLSDFGITNMKNLMFCLLSECHEIQTVIAGKESPESKELESALQNLYFLHIYYLKNLVSIWKAPYNYECLSGLRLLALHMCPKLSVVFSRPLLINLNRLEVLIIEDCPKLERVVSRTIDESIGSSDKSIDSRPFLPSLRRILLLCLRDLISISSEFHIAPNLEKIGFYGCGKLESLFTKEMSGENLKVIRGESEWWEKTKKCNELEWGEQRLDRFQSIFSQIDKEGDVLAQMEETVLEEPRIYGPDSKI